MGQPRGRARSSPSLFHHLDGRRRSEAGNDLRGDRRLQLQRRRESRSRAGPPRHGLAPSRDRSRALQLSLSGPRLQAHRSGVIARCFRSSRVIATHGNESNNVAQWQWVAGCGADAAPYFRIFNPILQGEKFDKEGLYVKKWVPELEKVPNKFIHKPWEMELKYQQAIKTIIGKDYPQPIVIHEKARASALEAFQSLKKN